MVGDADAFINREAEPLPHLELIEPVAHMPAGLDDEFLALVTFGVGELGIVIAQRESPERDVPCFILHHIGVDRGRQRVLRLIANALKRR